jgi:hypothetical protein
MKMNKIKKYITYIIITLIILTFQLKAQTAVPLRFLLGITEQHTEKEVFEILNSKSYKFSLDSDSVTMIYWFYTNNLTFCSEEITGIMARFYDSKLLSLTLLSRGYRYEHPKQQLDRLFSVYTILKTIYIYQEQEDAFRNIKVGADIMNTHIGALKNDNMIFVLYSCYLEDDDLFSVFFIYFNQNVMLKIESNERNNIKESKQIKE